MSEKTIRMPKALLDKWLAALRSGEYRQTDGFMYDKALGGYCCLGVLEKVASGQVEAGGYPTKRWRDQFGVCFFDKQMDDSRGNPYLPSLLTSAAEANDKGHTFAEIADAIEACAEAT